jgi:uncharacterized repeat protein (TIGR03806 family)
VAVPKPTGAGGDSFPRSLSQSKCFDSKDPRVVVPGAIPYSVNAPLWSDGAHKERWLAIPDGKKIHIQADDDWDLPVGSVLIKTFLLAGKRIETRLFMRHDDGQWAGYSYQWMDDESDAKLVGAGGDMVLLGSVDWTFPSREDCLKCHTSQAGGTLGLETAQLNGDLLYPNGRQANQVSTLAHIGLFDAPPAADVETLPRLPDPFGPSGTLESRARAYLHGNCAGCHRPDATEKLTLDFRYGTRLADTKSCNAIPQEKDLGTAPDGRLIAPGRPDLSIAPLRMRALDANRMPPIASRVLDERGVELIEKWITSLSACP